eukprot:353447-Chlamydomonas_euryale.AAC.10
MTSPSNMLMIAQAKHSNSCPHPSAAALGRSVRGGNLVCVQGLRGAEAVASATRRSKQQRRQGRAASLAAGTGSLSCSRCFKTAKPPARSEHARRCTI